MTRTAYIAIAYEDYYAVVLAYDNGGHSRTQYARHDDYDVAMRDADQRNAHLALTSNEATAIRIASMFRPGEYDQVLATL